MNGERHRTAPFHAPHVPRTLSVPVMPTMLQRTGATLWRWRWQFGVVALILVNCAVWLPYLNVPLDLDAAGFGIAAYWWARGDRLYDTITITRPQGIFVVYRLLQALGFGSNYGLHLAAAGCSTLGTLILMAIVSRVWDRGRGLLAALLLGLLIATTNLQGYAVKAELFMNVALLAGLWLLLLTDRQALGSRRWISTVAGCGLLAAIALLLKPSGATALPLAALWLLRRARAERAAWPQWGIGLAALGFGFLIGLLPAILHGMYTVPDRYLEAIVFNRLGQDSALSASLGYQLYRFANNTAALLIRLPILLVGLLGLWAVRRDDNKRGRDLLWLWTLTSLAGVAMGGHWYLHYFQQLAPALATATAVGLCALFRRPQGLAIAAGQGIAMAGLLSLGLTFLTILTPPADPAKLVPQYTDLRFDAVPAIVAYVTAHTAPGDSIYVAYDHADIYYLTERRPAGRWLYGRELWLTPGAFDEQVRLLADPATAPRYIVEMQPFDSSGFDPDGALRAIVARDYQLETTIDGIDVYRRR